ncbi:MAG TPA: hypothetical protein VIJ68_03615 [Candidatus Saccharimonadales bacterium]
MQKHNSIIDINGRRYNAKTGQWVTSGKGNRVAILVTDEPAPLPAPEPPVKRRFTSRRAVHHQASHQPAASRALMRRAVKKPEPARQHRLKAQANTDTLARKALSKVMTKPSARRLDEKRLQHAKHVPKSHLISRFSEATMIGAYIPPVTPQPQTRVHEELARQTPTPAQATEAFLERALEQATGYQELPSTKRRRLLHRRRHVAVR